MKKYLFIWVIALITILGFLFFRGTPDGTTDHGAADRMTTGVVAEDNIMNIYNSLSPQAKALYFKQSEELTKPVPERIVELDELTIGCFGPAQVLQMSTEDTNLGGQCCGALKDAEAYNVQLKALDRFIEKNGNVDDLIPKDPYDVPVEHAQKLVDFDRTITLSASQQAMYDEAMRMSHHGGPCCCKCWKWYVMSGLAKKLIVDYGWNENRIAELWDTSSSCGHAHDTNMHKHYNVPEGEEGSHSHGADLHDQAGHDHEAMQGIDVGGT